MRALGFALASTRASHTPPRTGRLVALKQVRFTPEPLRTRFVAPVAPAGTILNTAPAPVTDWSVLGSRPKPSAPKEAMLRIASPPPGASSSERSVRFEAVRVTGSQTSERILLSAKSAKKYLPYSLGHRQPR